MDIHKKVLNIEKAYARKIAKAQEDCETMLKKAEQKHVLELEKGKKAIQQHITEKLLQEREQLHKQGEHIVAQAQKEALTLTTTSTKERSVEKILTGVYNL